MADTVAIDVLIATDIFLKQQRRIRLILIYSNLYLNVTGKPNHRFKA